VTPSGTPIAGPGTPDTDLLAPSPVEVAPPAKPPATSLLAYRLLGLRLPEEHRAWVVADVASPSFLWWRALRTFLWAQVLIVLYAVGQHAGLGRWPGKVTYFRGEMLAAAAMLFSSRDALVRRALRWHRIDKHGRPVASPKPFARLENLQAAVLGVLVLIAWTGASTAFGVGLRPTGIKAAPCREADPVVFDRIRANAAPGTTFLTTRMVKFGESFLIVATLPPKDDVKPQPGKPVPKFDAEAWVVTGDKIERIAGKEMKTSTSFPPITAIDRLGGNAIERAFQCLGKKPVR
jgi:hypothetical protein